jgi:thiamine biosynthesis protein ThiS
MSRDAVEASGAATCPVMRLVVNGDGREVPRGTTVAGLLVALGLESRPVLVERNGEAVFPRDFAVTALGDGDRIEIVRMVAGG